MLRETLCLLWRSIPATCQNRARFTILVLQKPKLACLIGKLIFSVWLQFSLTPTEIIKEVRTNGEHLTELLRVRVEDLQDDCLQRALRVAVEVGNHYSVGKLIVKGADNIMEALKLAKEQKQHHVRAMLLLVIAAAEGNRDLVLKLFGDYTNKVSPVRRVLGLL